MLSGSSAIRAMFTEGRRLKQLYGEENVYDYSLGNPNVPAPEKVRRTAISLLEQEESVKLHGYTANSGFEEVRLSVAQYVNELYGTAVTADHIVMTVGAAGGLNVILKVLLDPCDEVVVFAPYFGEYKNYVENYGGVLVVSNTDDRFFPDVKNLEKQITKRTKAVIINNPNNPTGVIYPRETLEQLCGLLRLKEEEYGHPVYIISDEPYRELVYDGDEVCWLPLLYDHTIVCYSYSKSLSLPGERIGYLVIGEKCADCGQIIQAAGIATRILGFVNAPTLQQKIIGACLREKCDVDIYRKNRDLLYASLTEYGYDCVRPQGAFYMFVRSPIKDDRTFCELAKNKRLLIVPGSSFGAPGYVRLAYCVPYDMIVRSLPVFKEMIEEVSLNA